MDENGKNGPQDAPTPQDWKAISAQLVTLAARVADAQQSAQPVESQKTR